MSLKKIVPALRAFLFRRRLAYVTTFQGEIPKIVLEDLSKFCRATDSTFNPDPYLAARLDGRREVWLRLQAHLNLTEEQLWNKFGRPDLDN